MYKGEDSQSGKSIYQSNYRKGTPKAVKHREILDLIQNVWSKKPLKLNITDSNGTVRQIEAKFDPAYDPDQNIRTDASKLMAGNRKGSASDRRVTLDLAGDWYKIAESSIYDYSKKETGKNSITHENVLKWHYFINDILFQEYGEAETAPYMITIDVKEKLDGNFVYSISAEKRKSDTPRTLLAEVNRTGKTNAANV